MVDIAGTALVLLAAGLSRRYGAVGKLVADFRGKPLALHAAETLSQMTFAAHIAVCRAGDDDLAALLAGTGFVIVRNPDTARGLSSSLALGVGEAARHRPDAVMVCLADMPSVTKPHLLALIEGLSQAGIVASSVGPGQVPMPPSVFAAARIPELLALEGDQGARPLLSQALLVEAPPGSLADFDTPEDFRRQRTGF